MIRVLLLDDASPEQAVFEMLPFEVDVFERVDQLETALKAGAQWEVLAVNDVADEVNATPALSDGRVYVRTRSALYCFTNMK